MATLSIKECLSFGWKTFWSRPWLFVLAGAVVFLVNLAFSIPQSALENATETLQGTPEAVMLLLGSVVLSMIGTVVSIFLQMGTTRFTLKAHDAVSETEVKDLAYFTGFWRYIGASALTFLAVLAGFILLIIPGIIASLALSLTLYLVIDKGLGPVQSFKQSLALTKGHRWNLFLLTLALVGVNILGFLAFVIGLAVSVPVSMLAMAHAYRILAGEAPEESVVVETAPEMVPETGIA